MKKLMVMALAALLLAGGCMAEEMNGFTLDNVLATEDLGDIHYNLYVPDSYDGSAPYALHVALPGWEGLYFQGVGEDLRWERMPHESRNYIPDVIVVSPQLNDWGETSARMAVRLTEYFIDNYSIDPSRVCITGYSGGGETLSRVMEYAPELYSAALFMSSQWDGDPAPLVAAGTPLYIFAAEHDSYYGSEPARRAWRSIHDLYIESGLTEDEITDLLVLDVRPDSWFDDFAAAHPDVVGSAYAMDYHGAGMMAAYEGQGGRTVRGRRSHGVSCL